MSPKNTPTKVPGKELLDDHLHATLPMSIFIEFWISVVDTFEALYEVVFQSVYSKAGKDKRTPQATKQCVTNLLESFPGIVPFTQLTFFR